MTEQTDFERLFKVYQDEAPGHWLKAIKHTADTVEIAKAIMVHHKIHFHGNDVAALTKLIMDRATHIELMEACNEQT